MMNPFNNEVAEKAVLLVKSTYRDYQASTTISGGLGRMIVTHPRFGRHTALDARREACLFRMVSIVEAFVDVLFELTLQHEVPIKNLPIKPTIGAALIADALDNAESWRGRKVFGTRYDIPITSFKQWDRIDAAIAARNSIAHGLGRLTRKQKPRELENKLRSIGVTLSDGRLRIRDQALAELCTLFLDFISYIDQKRGLVE